MARLATTHTRHSYAGAHLVSEHSMSVMRTGAMDLVQLAVSWQKYSSIPELRQQRGLCMGPLFELVPHAGCVARAASDLAEVW